MTTKHKELRVPPASPAGNIELVAVGQCVPSPTQPRKHFDPEAMKELTASIREHGIVQPLIARDLGPGTVNGKPADHLFEIVSGERRWRAAGEIGLEHVPCLVRPMTDGQAMEIQTIENLQRADLHPMEEARGYEALLARCALTVDQVAAKTGKSKSCIYQRLRLCALVPEAEKLFLDGKLDVSTAFLVARVPVKLQKKCAEEVAGVHDTYDPTPMQVRQAREHIECNYMLRLADAAFDVKDAHLVSAAGACSTCPKRTGNDKDLFGDIKGADVCTDPDCFREKVKQHLIALKLRMEAAGRVVLPEDESKKLWQYGSLKYNSAYVDLKDHCYEDPKRRTFAQLLGKEAKKEAVVAIDPDGKAHDLLTKDRVAEALKAAGVKPRNLHNPADDAREREKQKEERAVAAEVALEFQEAVGKAAVKVKPVEFARWIVAGLLELYDYDERPLAAAARRYPKLEDKDDAYVAMGEDVGKMSLEEATALIAELMADPDEKADAKLFKVDLAALTKKVKAERKKQAEEAKRQEASGKGKEAGGQKAEAETLKKDGKIPY
ncbi:MAG: ParB/RepB/Spo0J family partition protein [Verrucomicrobia bacterium]|nr:ParB/RepB/Spo0J family partition protein [Verrucomicrobiota bacterium]